MLIKNKIFLTSLVIIVGVLFNGCGADRAGEVEEKQVAGVVERDSDGDGIIDSVELNLYFTDPFNTDSDNDGLLDGDEIKIYETNATNADTDGDGISDGDEVKVYETNPLNSDTDADGLKDGLEIKEYDSNPNNPDTDADGLADGKEITESTNILDADSDDDGLKDGEEVNSYETNPNNADSDNDGLKDGEEVHEYGTNPTNPDSDGDGLKDGEELNSLTNPLLADSDADGLTDGEEVKLYGTNPLESDSDDDGLTDGEEIKTYILNPTNPKNPDTDGDGLSDGEEVNSYGTNPIRTDSDGDGLDDNEEVKIYNTNPLNEDSDGDILKDGEEVNLYATNPLNEDSDGDGLADGAEVNNHGTNPALLDSDEDGLTDGQEINIYGTNPNEEDSDGDTLKDGAEVNNMAEPTNPLLVDSDGDGLLDNIEVPSLDLNASNPDTDGDCLLDKYELNFYGTATNNSDTDGDGVDDGVEVYSYTVGELNTTCLSNPEQLIQTHNLVPAMDNIPMPDVINALDPSNDSDGDGQSNIQESNCIDGDAFDASKRCPFLTETEAAAVFSEYGYSYMPGGFDVNNDGINEGGFWLSTYQARKSDENVPDSEVVDMMSEGYNQFIRDNFELINGEGLVSDYTSEILNTYELTSPELLFKKSEVLGTPRFTAISPYTVMLSSKAYKITDTDGNILDISLHLMSLKQYTQVRMLLDADLANGGDGTIIRNGILGNDTNVPIATYSIKVEEFGESYKEYTSSLVQLIENTNNSVVFSEDDIENWWGVDLAHIKRNITNGIQQGANDRIDVGFNIGTEKDNYAVVVMGGRDMDLTQGTAGMTVDSSATDTNGIGFRIASGYLD